MKNKSYDFGGKFCRTKKDIAKNSNQKNSGYSLVFILAFLICLAGVIYVFQINKVATIGYGMKEKENRINSLREENMDLEIKAARLRSIYIFQIQTSLNMEDENNSDAEKKSEGMNNETESDELAEKEELKEEKNFLSKMKKPKNVSFLEVEIEKAFAMK